MGICGKGKQLTSSWLRSWDRKDHAPKIPSLTPMYVYGAQMDNYLISIHSLDLGSILLSSGRHSLSASFTLYKVQALSSPSQSKPPGYMSLYMCETYMQLIICISNYIHSRIACLMSPLLSCKSHDGPVWQLAHGDNQSLLTKTQLRTWELIRAQCSFSPSALMVILQLTWLTGQETGLLLVWGENSMQHRGLSREGRTNE